MACEYRKKCKGYNKEYPVCSNPREDPDGYCGRAKEGRFD